MSGGESPCGRAVNRECRYAIRMVIDGSLFFMFAICSHIKRQESSPNFVVAQSLLTPRMQPLGNPAGCRSYQEGMTGNALQPDLMSSGERLDEVAEILAA